MNANYLSAAALVMCAAGCAPSFTPIAATAYDHPAVDFSTYATFFVMKGNGSGDAAMDDLVISSVETALTGKGWIEVAEGEGQAAVVVHTATPDRHTYQAFYDGWGGWDWRAAPPGGSAGFVEDYQVGTVVVTIFDADSKRPIWRGFAADPPSNSPRHTMKTTEQAIAKMFSTIPPPATPGFAQSRHPDTPRPDSTTPSMPVNSRAPAIFFSTVPALLVRIDGEPIYRPIPGTDLQRIINTKPLIVREPAGMYYLKVLDGWMEAYALEGGSWSVSGVAPDGSTVALRQAVASRTVDLLDRVDLNDSRGTPSLAYGPAPAIFIATGPAELIVTDGAMVFAAIDGTSLQYVANTTADVFREPTDQELYVLISGRWFRSWKTDGPWQPVPSGELPADFARIPPGSPKGRVKVSIAGPR